MALQAGLGLIGGAITGAKNLGWGLLKWALPAGALGAGTEMATNSDGKGGWLSNLWRGGSQATAYELSATQAVDGLFDGISMASNKIATFISGGLATILDAIAHFTGSELVAGWAQKCRDFEQRTQDVINNRADRSRQNGADGNLAAPGADPVVPVGADPNDPNTGSPGSQMAGLVAGGLGATALTASAISAVTGRGDDAKKAADEKAKADRAAMSPHERMQADMDATHADAVRASGGTPDVDGPEIRTAGHTPHGGGRPKGRFAAAAALTGALLLGTAAGASAGEDTPEPSTGTFPTGTDIATNASASGETIAQIPETIVAANPESGFWTNTFQSAAAFTTGVVSGVASIPEGVYDSADWLAFGYLPGDHETNSTSEAVIAGAEFIGVDVQNHQTALGIGELASIAVPVGGVAAAFSKTSRVTQSIRAAESVSDTVGTFQLGQGLALKL